jgi:putative tRNA (guanine-N(7)-)-methyltransferase
MNLFTDSKLIYDGRTSQLSALDIRQLLGITGDKINSFIQFYQTYDGILFPKQAMMFRNKFYSVAKGDWDKIEISFFLENEGVVHLKTDSNFLFTYTTYVVEKNNLPLLFRTEDLYGNETNGAQADDIDGETKEILGIHTYYENQWIERGLNIKYMKFRLPHKGALVEPEIEIELDDYRSFKRTKRSEKETAR